MAGLKSTMKNLPVGFAEEAEGMDEEQLRSVVVESSNNIKIAKEEMLENDGYKSAKEAFAQVAGPLKDAVKAQSAKVAYALHLLEQKGKI